MATGNGPTLRLELISVKVNFITSKLTEKQDMSRFISFFSHNIPKNSVTKGMKTYEIYKITNKIDGKVYIGQTTIGWLKRFKQHLSRAKNNNHYSSPVLKNAMRKHGLENFYCEMIDNSSSCPEELNEKEIFYIKKYDSISPNGYNILLGGALSDNSNFISIIGHSKKQKNKYGHKGVKKRGDGFKATISYQNKNIYIGFFWSAMDAAKAYDYYALKLYKENASLNFPELRENYINNNVKLQRKDERWKKKYKNIEPPIEKHFENKNLKNEYIGIFFVKRNKTWRTKFDYRSYLTPQDAAIAYDIIERKNKGDCASLNYPENISLYDNDEINENCFRNRTNSKYRGVSFKDGKWLAQICIKRKPKHIGYFCHELDAAKAYDAKAKEVFGKAARLNFDN